MISARGAASPSMLKMLSVTTTMRASGLAERRAQRRRESSLAVSLWGKMRRVAPLSGWKTERERRRETCSRAASSDSNERMLGRGLRLLRGCGGWWRGWRSGGDLDRDGWGDGGDGFPFRRVRVDDWLRGFGGADEFDLVLEEGVAADEGWAAGFAEAEGRRDEECGFGAGFEEPDAFLEPEGEGANGFAGGGAFWGFFEFGAVEECAADGDGDDIAFLGLGAVAGFLDDVLET